MENLWPHQEYTKAPAPDLQVHRQSHFPERSEGTKTRNLSHLEMAMLWVLSVLAMSNPKDTSKPETQFFLGTFFLVLNVGNEGMIQSISIHSNPPNPIHFIRLAPVILVTSMAPHRLAPGNASWSLRATSSWPGLNHQTLDAVGIAWIMIDYN